MKLFAVIASVVIIAAGAGYALHVYSRRSVSRPKPKPAGYFGPRVVVYSNSPAGSIANNTTINVQIFSAVPSAFAKTGLSFYSIAQDNQWNNSVNDELLNATMLPGNASTGRFFLSAQFNSIAREWMSLLSKDTGTNYPSLTVEAVKTVVLNGSMLLYQYYNNIPFNPFSLSVISANSTLLASTGLKSWFGGSSVNLSDYSRISLTDISFSLALVFPSVPIQVISANASANREHSYSYAGTGVPAAASPESCHWAYYYTYPSTTSNTLEKTTYANGTLPLIGVHIGRNADQGNSLIDLAASVNVQNDTIKLTSNQVYSNPSGSITTTMSTQPSFSHLANVTVGTSGGVTSVIPEGISEKLGVNHSYAQNLTTALAGIQGVEYEFQHYSRYTYNYRYYWEEFMCPPYRYPPYLLSKTLVSEVYDGNFTIGEIVHVNSTAGLNVVASPVSIAAAWVIQHYLLQDSNGSVQLNASGSGTDYQSPTIWAMTYGWLNAANAYKKAEQALSIFSSALSMGLAVIAAIAAANQLDFDAAGSLIARTISLAATVLGQFSTISSISGITAGGAIWGFSNYPLVSSGSNYTMPFYESSSGVMLTLPNGNSYFFYAPEDYLNVTSIA
ncbi:MAG: hypothetical protein M1351_10235 [Candidatus Thermoplasmatota archaeon]|nr:hypothetical protein [Candidatus Thermoplasmatota archaeon]